MVEPELNLAICLQLSLGAQDGRFSPPPTQGDEPPAKHFLYWMNLRAMLLGHSCYSMDTGTCLELGAGKRVEKGSGDRVGWGWGCHRSILIPSSVGQNIYERKRRE